jgi:hypothetical protein
MIRRISIVAAAGLFVLATASLALCAEIVGRVSDVANKPVSGVQIIVKNASGKILGKVLTDNEGRYSITGLAPGAYNYVLEPLGTSFKAGTAAAYLSNKGLTMNWKVSTGTAAVALATDGRGGAVIAGDPFGFSPAAFAALVAGGTAVVAGGVVGGYAAAGGFSGPTSPSR